MSRKILAYFALVAVLMIAGCAKRNTAYEESNALTLLAQVPVVGDPSEIAVDNSNAYIALDQGGLAAIRLSDFNLKWYPEMSSQDGSVEEFWRTRKLAVSPEYNRLFLNEIQFTDKIHIIDTSEPDSLMIYDAITGGTYDIQDMAIREIEDPTNNNVIEVAFCSNIEISYGPYDTELWLGVSNSMNAPALVAGVELDANNVYGAAQQRGLVAFDKESGTLLSEFSVSGEAQKLTVRNGYAYIAARQGGLQIVDIRDIQNPVLAAEFATTGYASDVDYSSGKLAISSGSGGAYVFDVSDPANPILIQRITECGYVNTVLFKDDVLIVGSRDNGIYFYQMN